MHRIVHIEPPGVMLQDTRRNTLMNRRGATTGWVPHVKGDRLPYGKNPSEIPEEWRIVVSAQAEIHVEQRNDGSPPSRGWLHSGIPRSKRGCHGRLTVGQRARDRDGRRASHPRT